GFTVPSLPDLTIAKAHSSSFIQGQGGASYTITVKNVGSMQTTGAVAVTDTLPTGLTATAIAGTGWNCTLAGLTCSRTDVLGSGGSYPAITVTVNVSASASTSVVNSASVSGGGEINTTNDTATDVTTISVNVPGGTTITSNTTWSASYFV